MVDSMDNIEVHMISNRPRLDEFIKMWDSVVVENGNDRIDCIIKVLMLDFEEKKLVLNNGITVEFIKQRTSWKTTFMNQAWARNELLCYSNVDSNSSKYILFYDDWQKPEPHILLRHLEYLKKEYSVCGRRFECDKDGNGCKDDYRNNYGGYVRCCGYGEWWTCNSSTKLEYILKVNGFDNRFCGGTAGEDYDMAMRISKLGGTASSFIYNPDAICYHYCHDHLGSCRKENIDGHSHNTSEWKYIPEYGHKGKWDNMDGGDLYEFWWEGPIKYFKCKRCGDIGILDSMQVYYHNRDKNVCRCENGLEQVREVLKKVG